MVLRKSSGDEGKLGNPAFTGEDFRFRRRTSSSVKRARIFFCEILCIF